MADSQDLLQRVTDSVVDSLGFGAAAINLRLPDDEMLVVAFSGPAEGRRKILGTSVPLSAWQQMFDCAEVWGRQLDFVEHRVAPDDFPDASTWTPDPADGYDLIGDWRPGDELFARLYGSAGELIGVLSVDLPPGGRRPDDALCRSLEALVLTAQLAIEQASLHEQNRAANGLMRTLLELSPVGFALLDEHRRPILVNAAYERFVGEHSDRVIAGAFDDSMVDPSAALAGLGVVDAGHHELALGDDDAQRRWLRVHAVPLAEVTDRATHLLEVEDVTERRRAARRLRFQAEHDTLTGLLNRAAILEHLERALVSQMVTGGLFGVFYCDLDSFKQVNDEYGHSTGDTYLREVSGRLAANLREGDALGRLGGDEFVVVTGSLDTEQSVAAMAARLIDAVAVPLELTDRTFLPSVSVGVAVVTAKDETAEHVLHRADAALYAAKRLGGGLWQMEQAQLAP